MVRSTGFEPVTVRLEGGCSIQLSYERMCQDFLGSQGATVKIRLEKLGEFVCSPGRRFWRRVSSPG
jgi:hypothetical protein